MINKCQALLCDTLSLCVAYKQLLVSIEDAGMGGKSYDVTVLLGRRDDPLLVVYARQLAEQMK